MKPTAAIGALCFALGGCASDAVLLEQTPVGTETIAQPYKTLASCVYQRLDGPGVAQVDLGPSPIVKIHADGGGVRYFEATFTGIGPKTTCVDITTARTMWGPYPAGDRVKAAIQSCR